MSIYSLIVGVRCAVPTHTAASFQPNCLFANRVIESKKQGITPTAAQQQAAIDVVVKTTIPHEIGHSLNLEHCSDISEKAPV